MRKVLVTGGSGFLGSSIVNLLIQKNFKVIGEILRYKDFYVFNSSIKRDFLDEFSSNNPSTVII